MSNIKQAVLSAAEVCLRSLGYLPQVPLEEYVIQPYRGGQVIHTIMRPRNVLAILADMQHSFGYCNIIHRIKKIEGQLGTCSLIYFFYLFWFKLLIFIFKS